MNNKKNLILVVALSLAIYANGQVQFTSNDGHKVISVVPEYSTGLDEVYVVYDTRYATMQYTAKSGGANVKWYKFGTLGGGYAEPIVVEHNGNMTTLKNLVPNSGYIIEDEGKRTFLWVVNYADYHLQLQTITADENSDCATTILNVSGEGTDIVYYTINGGLKKLDRQMKMTYNNLKWQDDEKEWKVEELNENLSGFKPTILLQSPYCSTKYTLCGDAFLKEWGESLSINSDEVPAKAVSVAAVAIQENKENTNEKNDEIGGENLGGSAPVTIDFEGFPTEAVSHMEWQMSYTPDFEEISERYTENNLHKVFEEAGTTYWRYVGTNEVGGCEAESDVFTVNIGESSLRCPNAFSPGASEGTNDEWKGSYKSIIKFKCWIFNSWGVQMCELNDPSQGWNGKYKGKIVPSGVYYYVIEAEGSEGKKYKLKGDINIVGLKKDRQTTSGSKGE